MRYLPLLLLLASCQRWSWNGTADLLLPDEFQIGQGSSSMNTVGGYNGHHDMFEYDGEGESTYAALTWRLPQVEDESGMSRETQRNLSLLIDQMVDQEIEENTPTSNALGIKLQEGAVPPPAWLPYALGGVLLAGILALLLFSKRQDKW